MLQMDRAVFFNDYYENVIKKNFYLYINVMIFPKITVVGYDIL